MARIVGFLLQPPAWVGAAPEVASLDDVRGLRRTVLERRLRCGLAARVTLDGEFLFDFSGRAARVDAAEHDAVLRDRVMLLNAFLALLHTEYRRCEKKSHQLMLVDARELLLGDRFDALSVVGNDTVAHLLDVSDPSTYALRSPPSDRRLWRLAVYPQPVVARALDGLDELVLGDGLGVEAADLLVRACAAHHAAASHAALIQSWALVERLLTLDGTADSRR